MLRISILSSALFIVGLTTMPMHAHARLNTEALTRISLPGPRDNDTSFRHHDEKLAQNLRDSKNTFNFLADLFRRDAAEWKARPRRGRN